MLEKNIENYNYHNSERRTEQIPFIFRESNTVFVKDISELFEKLFRTGDLTSASTQRGTVVVVSYAFETSDEHILKKHGFLLPKLKLSTPFPWLTVCFRKTHPKIMSS